MIRKFSAIAILLCLAFATNSFAAVTTWQISTKLTNAGGQLAVNGAAAQITVGNTVTKVINSVVPAQTIPVVITATTAGYTISALTVNGAAIPAAVGLTSFTAYVGPFNVAQVHPATNYSASLTQSVTATFVRANPIVTPVVDAGGTVVPNVPSVVTYYVAGSNPVTGTKTFTFTAPVGNQMTVAISPASGNGLLATSVSGQTTTATLTQVTGNLTITGTLAAKAVAGAAQTILLPASGSTVVTLDSTGSTAGTFAWSQTAGPSVTLSNAAAAKPTFTATAVGQYSFKLVVTVGAATSTAYATVNITNSAATAARTQCAQCHESHVPVVGPTNYASWSSSRHRTQVVMCYNCHVGSNTGGHPGTLIGNPGLVSALTFVGTSNGVFCANCHSQVTGNATATHKTVGMTCGTCHSQTNNKHNINPADPVSLALSTDCYGCHNTNPAIWPAAHDATNTLDNCDECHNLASMHAIKGKYVAGSAAQKHQGAPTYALGANGAQDNATFGWYSARTGYLSQGAICADCHNDASNGVNGGFSEGGHGRISTNPMNPFVHYDWKARQTAFAAGVWGSRQNGNCTRCHTAYGFMKFSVMTTNYSRLQLKGSVQNDSTTANNVLICVSCHSDISNGTLRTDAQPKGNPTTLANGYFALFTSATATVMPGDTKIQIGFPGFHKSGICIPCHSGRSTDQVFTSVINRAKTDLKNYSTIGTSYYQHGKNMGQTFIGKGAHDFSGKLATIGGSGHMTVEMPATIPGADKGPCIGCHYTNPGKDHSLEVVPYSNFDMQHGCMNLVGCHIAANPDVAGMKASFQASVKALTILAHQKLDPLRATASELNTERVNVRFGRLYRASNSAADVAKAAIDGYGAWYNWQILKTYDPAAFVHNPQYARQLINDTIDYLDDGIINNSTSATIASLVGQTVQDVPGAGAAPVAVTFTNDDAVAAIGANGKAGYIYTPACNTCHSDIVTAWASSKHAASTTQNVTTFCNGCHLSGSHPYSKPTCIGCHVDKTFNGNAFTFAPTPLNHAANILDGTVKCITCHTTHGTALPTAYDQTICNTCHGQGGNNNSPAYKSVFQNLTTFAHNASFKYTMCFACHSDINSSGSITDTSLHANGTINLNGAGCVGCHSAGRNVVEPGFVNDNSGVRMITGVSGEFGANTLKNSHHIVNGLGDPTDDQCAVCHMEGIVTKYGIRANGAYHVSDAKVHLRNGNTTLFPVTNVAGDNSQFAWDPANPDHTAMDNFCFSCHNAAGAISSTGIAQNHNGNVASATNPFGDDLKNNYDGMSRGKVVNAFSQFSSGNASHHAVRSQRYSGRTRTAGDPRIITAVNPDSTPGSALGFAQNSSATLMMWGPRRTIYDAGFFNSTFTPLGKSAGDLGDDSTLHCGDCHTVGQWTNANTAFNKAAIGAHGSVNEYMLRNSAGTDARHNASTSGALVTFDITSVPSLVCYNCHVYKRYGMSGKHEGVNGGGDCNDDQWTYNSAGKSGSATANGTPARLARGTGNVSVWGGSGGGNMFGIQCANCHNAGNPITGSSFGGIHGGNNTYTSGNGITQSPYRFMPGLGNVKFAPNNMDKGAVVERTTTWEEQTLTTGSRATCYTLNTATTAPSYNMTNPADASYAAGQLTMGTWGACTDHGGSSTAGGHAGTSNLFTTRTNALRDLQRPLKY